MTQVPVVVAALTLQQQALIQVPNLQADEPIVVRAGGRTGTFAVQIPSPFGATDIETALTRSGDASRMQGAQPVEDAWAMRLTGSGRPLAPPSAQAQSPT